MIKRLFLILAIVLASTFAMPQAALASVFTWSIHNLTFEVPDGGTVTYNSANHFEIVWNDMAIIITLYNKQGVNDKNTDIELQRRANDFNMYDTNMGKLKVKGFKCKTLDGTMPDGSRALLANLICNKKDLFITVTINYLLGNLEIAEDMVKSFTIGRQKVKEEKKQKVQTEADAKVQEEKLKKEAEEKKKPKKEYQTYDI